VRSVAAAVAQGWQTGRDPDSPRWAGGEMTPAESAELGSILRRLVPAIKAATDVQRVYYLAVMERAPHFHLWLVPRKNEGELRGAAYLAQQPPLTASYSAAEAMSRKIREQFEQS
jgi:diadenosine tetraphosphate (Ap4A) HIT family hydrolase